MRQSLNSATSRSQLATSFLELAASGRVVEAFDNHISPNFRHHNPHFRGDAESLKAGMAEAHEKFPDTALEVQHTFEEGDMVAVHSRVSHGSDQPEIAVVHIFRFEGDQIAELWDVGQENPKDSPNDNGMF